MSAYSDSQSEDGELARSPLMHPQLDQHPHDDLDFSLSDEDREAADSLDIKPPQATVRPSHRERRAHKRSNKDRHKDSSRRENKRHLYRERESKPEKLKRDHNTKTADRDLDSSKEYFKDKAYYREKDAFREKDMVREKEMIRDKEMYREKDIPRDKDMYREKDIPRDKDVYREKDIPRDKDVYREKDIPRDKDVYREKEVLIRDKELYREREAYREREHYRERDMYRDNGAYREKEVIRQKESYREKEMYKDKDIEREREAYLSRERMRYPEQERKHKGGDERMSRSLTDENVHNNEKENRDRSSGDKELEDLRSRLLSKRISKELQSHEGRKHEQGREHSGKDGKSHRTSSLDKSQQERRMRLLEADREMEKRKQSSRTELEERRKERRRRGVKRLSSPVPAAAPTSNATASRLEASASKKSRPAEPTPVADDTVVMLSDTSDMESRSDSHHSDQEEGDHSRTESEAQSSTDESESESESKSEGEEEEQEKNDEPEKQAEIEDQVQKERSKSPEPRSDPRNSPPSNNMIRSRTRSRSRSHSFSPPPQDENGVQSPEEKTEEDKEEAEKLMNEKISSMPPYFPALQGCRSVEEFQCLNRIEEGTYGVVYRARDKTTEEIVALKRLKMEKEKEGFPITSLREINTLLKGQHPNIVTVREIVVGSNMDKIFIVMDYVEHDLKSLMETMRGKKQVFLPGEVKCLMVQLLQAVHHLHDNWILHRDLKTSNLLLSHKGILKVGDFGLAREYGSPLRPYTPIVVTLWYRAPELLLCCKEYSTHIDMWSVGCIFAEFITMNPLFPGKSEVDQLNRIFKDLGTPSEQVWPGYAQLPAVQKMTFAEHPAGGLRQRAGPDLLSEAGLSLLQAFLNYDPVRRITADTALQHPYFKEQPVAIEPAMFPTWPAKSEGGRRATHSPRPPAGGAFYAHVGGDDEALGFHMAAAAPHAPAQQRSLHLPAPAPAPAPGPGPGFSLKF